MAAPRSVLSYQKYLVVIRKHLRLIHDDYSLLSWSSSKLWLHLSMIRYISICLTHTKVWEAMGEPCSCVLFIKPVFIMQVTWESVSGTTSHTTICIRYCKSRALCQNVQWNQSSYGNHTTKLYWTNIAHLLPLALLLVLCTCNNTDSNKLIKFSHIALYHRKIGIINTRTK